MGSLRQALGLAAAAAIFCAVPGHSDAEEGRQVAIWRFEGPKRVRARNQVIYRLKDHVHLVPPKHEGVDVVIDGVVRRRRRGFSLHLTVRAVGEGGEVERVVLPLRPSGRFTNRGRRKVRKELIPVIEGLPLPGAPAPDEPEPGAVAEEPAEPEKEAEPAKEAEPEKEPAPEEEPAPAKGEAQPKKKDEDARQAERPAASARSPRPGWGRSLVSFSFGPSLLRRDLGFDVADLHPNRPRPYRGFFPAGHAEGQLYPLGHGGVTFLRDLGLDFEVGASPPFHSRVAGIGDLFVTRYSRWSVGLRYRFRAIDRLELQAGAGYGMQKFDLEPDLAGGGEVPPGTPASVNYTAIRAGGGVRLRVGRLVPFLEGRYLLVRDGGQIEGGQMFGSASSSGFGGAAGLEARFAGWLVLRLGARYARFRLDFLGTGDRSDLDGDGSADVRGAVDQYFGLGIRAGVVL